jgi:predicted nucleotidyltransferase
MARSPKDPKEIFTEITADYKGAFGEELVSIILYGSAAGGDYRPGKSDINFMVVLSENGIDRISKAFRIVTKWRKRNVAVPLLLTEDYLKDSLDTFPVEYLNFQREHLLVFGKDILEGLEFEPRFIRLQCEREIKGKLLLLREAFLESNGKARALSGLIGRSLAAFIAIFEALIFMKGGDLPAEKGEIVRAACKAFDLDEALFGRLLEIKRETFKPGEAEIMTLFEGYLREVGKLAKQVDELGG